MFFTTFAKNRYPWGFYCIQLISHKNVISVVVSSIRMYENVVYFIGDLILSLIFVSVSRWVTLAMLWERETDESGLMSASEDAPLHYIYL